MDTHPAPAPRPLLVVDGANVVGSVPDGWWRDRRGAAERLRDRLVRVAEEGVAEVAGPVEVVLVVEGRRAGWSRCRECGWSRRRAAGTTTSWRWPPRPPRARSAWW